MRYLVLVCAIALAAFLYLDPHTRNAYHNRMHEVYGIDVAHHQQEIDWQRVVMENEEISFAFVKATEGESHVDKRFHKNWAQLAQTRLIRGAYHFFRPSIDAEKQAINFIRTVQLKPGDLPPVLDVEVTDRIPTPQLIEGVRTWLEKVEAHYGIRPIIYTGLNFHRKHLANQFSDYHFWIASYNWRPPRLSDGTSWKFWQFTDKGRLKGIPKQVDINTFNGSRYTLEQLCMPGGRPGFWEQPALANPGQSLKLDFSPTSSPKRYEPPNPFTSETPPVQLPPVPRFDSINNPAGVVTRPLRP
ncbi:MAG: glycoside hydrolase family 25 protein [Bacteroidetes bacterium]|nr:MAG: glycoside hydrolase family 25 protein [Bacteroidota bacterium]